MLGDYVSLSDELHTEVTTAQAIRFRSQIDVFLDALGKSDRSEFEEWLADGAPDRRAMYRVLKRRGLPVADSTFRNWVISQ
jgi:hypothetical protein